MSFTFANTANAQETIVVEEETFTVDDAYNCKTQYSVGKHDNWFLQLGAGIGVPLVENCSPRRELSGEWRCKTPHHGNLQSGRG